MNAARLGVPLEESDNAVMRRLQSRDPDALKILYDRHAILAYRVIMRVVHDKGVAEDLVQETFLRLWLRAGLFDSDKGNATSWLVRIAKNCVLDHVRSVGAKRTVGAEGLDRCEDPRWLAYVAARTALCHQGGGFEKALSQLSHQQRMVVNLTYFEGFTQTEIATRIGRPLGTVKTWLRSSLTSLRRTYSAPPNRRLGISNSRRVV